MKKTFISLLLSIITAFGCFALPACNFSIDGEGGKIQGELTQISAPKNVRVENDIVKWSSVSNADSYIVQVGTEENQATTTELQIPLSMILSESLNGFYVKVKALPSSSILYSESDWSAVAGPYDYNINSTSSGGTTGENSLTNWDSPIVQNGIGMTIDAINGGYIEMKAGIDAGIFNEEKLRQLPLYKLDLNENTAYYSEGESFEEYSEQYSKNFSAKLSRSVNAGISIPGVFSINSENSFSSSFSDSVRTKRNDSTKEYYYTHSQVYKSHRIWISGATNKKTFTNILSDSFLQEARAVSTEEEAVEFFRIYGTHLITEAFFGGKVDINYNIITNDSSFTEEKAKEISAGLKFAAGATIPVDGLEIEAGGSTESSISNTEQTIKTFKSDALDSEMKINTKGGDSISFASFSDLKNGFNQWMGTVPNNLALIDVPNGSLISLWDILPSTDEYKTVKTILEGCFKSQCLDSYAKQLETLYGIRFDGGKGTLEEPYLISTLQHFKNIAYKMDSHFKLLNDIDLGNWVPLGTVQWKHTAQEDNPENPFKGTLDGDGHTITYNSKVTNIDSNNDGAWGLFGSSNGAEFKNIKLKATIYSCPNDDGEKIDAWEFCMGGLVGLSIDTKFDNCELLSGSIISNKLTDKAWVRPGGTWYLGATYTGGLVGDARDGWFANCINNGTVTSEGYICFAGGIAGNIYNGATVKSSCKNNGRVDATYKVSAYYIWPEGYWGESGTGDLYGKDGAPYLTPNGNTIT